ncbi:hypothetical protein CTI12_AA379150 [Artemisia annua]|uniref:Importin N-terminal domain-containing protein n=1 Tax=Artemisia annua TaxID=35608 RepID=A0A2U1MAE6_ARTAN|nr:hypothetical protein CTI12_AA379150 [Artemisia annua]
MKDSSYDAFHTTQQETYNPNQDLATEGSINEMTEDTSSSRRDRENDLFCAMALSVSDLPAMYTLLSNSLSRDESVRKPAESNLAQSENLPGFCSCLMEVITAKDLASQVDVRLMASLYFKNSINRYWRNKRMST